MRFVAPARGAVDPRVFGRNPLRAWREFATWLERPEWPSVDELNAQLPAPAPARFACQSHELLRDGLHYELRIARHGLIATRQRNWHDLFNALVWLRFPGLKRVLNARQVAEVMRVGSKRRSREQYALTHFDEAGVIVVVREPALLALWDAHDWHSLFWRERTAWDEARIEVAVFGHALLEHALDPRRLLVGKALVVALPPVVSVDSAIDACTSAIRAGQLLRDPQELRPLPLSGIPGWHPDAESEAFHREAPCLQPLRAGRVYPRPLALG